MTHGLDACPVQRQPPDRRIRGPPLCILTASHLCYKANLLIGRLGVRPHALELTSFPGARRAVPELASEASTPRPDARLRRNRKAEWVAAAVRECRLSVDDLIWPIFLIEGTGARQRSPPCRWSSASPSTRPFAKRSARRGAGIPPWSFPISTRPARAHGSQALNAKNLFARRCGPSRPPCPRSDRHRRCARPYTSHGHDGLLGDGVVLNDESVAVLVQHALVQAAAGADIIAPSDMMDGALARFGMPLTGPATSTCRSCLCG